MIYYWEQGGVRCPVGICKGCKCPWHDVSISKDDMLELCRKAGVPVADGFTTGDPGKDVNLMWYTASLLQKDKQLKKLVTEMIRVSSDSDDDSNSSDSSSGDSSSSSSSSGDSSSSSSSSSSGDSSSSSGDSSSSSGDSSSSSGDDSSEEELSPPPAKKPRKDKGTPRAAYTKTADMEALRSFCSSQGLDTKGSAAQLRKRLIDSFSDQQLLRILAIASTSGAAP